MKRQFAVEIVDGNTEPVHVESQERGFQIDRRVIDNLIGGGRTQPERAGSQADFQRSVGTVLDAAGTAYNEGDEIKI